jgi:hypothetical protein
MNAPPSHGLPGYGLAPPSAVDALAFLARALGPDRAASVWLRACDDAGVPRGDLTPEQMLRASERLAREEGVVGVIGRSLAVRVSTYVLLQKTQAGGARGR